MTATTTAPTPSLLASTLRLAQTRAGVRTRRVLAAALVLSLVVHVAFTLWPVDVATTPDATPLTATLTELPPPPKPSTVAPAAPKPKPRRTSPVATAAPVEAPPAPPVDASAATARRARRRHPRQAPPRRRPTRS